VPHQLLPFVLVVGVLTLTPGPDMALVLRNGAGGGARAAWRTGLGCCAGISVYAAASAVGLAAVLAASATAFLAIKLVGAAYLVYLGVMALWHSRSRPRADVAAATAAAPTEPTIFQRGAAFRQGLVSNLLNPKIVLIFLTLIPQFVSPGEPPFRTTTILAATFLAMAVLWWRLFSLAIGALSRLLARDRVHTTIECVTGAVLIALGIRVALTT
jgi:threonine/homoserine/homoserine lactone efflux protein